MYILESSFLVAKPRIVRHAEDEKHHSYS